MSTTSRIVASRRFIELCAIDCRARSPHSRSAEAAAAPITFYVHRYDDVCATTSGRHIQPWRFPDRLADIRLRACRLRCEFDAWPVWTAELSHVRHRWLVSPFDSGRPSDIEVLNGPPGSDRLIFRAGVTGPSVGGFRPWRVSLSLTDPTGLALSSDALPSSFDVSQFTVNSFVLTFTNKADPYDPTSTGVSFTGVSGTLTSGSAGADAVAAVPEPATLTLLGGSLAAFAMRLRRKRRSAL